MEDIIIVVVVVNIVVVNLDVNIGARIMLQCANTVGAAFFAIFVNEAHDTFVILTAQFEISLVGAMLVLITFDTFIVFAFRAIYVIFARRNLSRGTSLA
jgi:hypothetical protein